MKTLLFHDGSLPVDLAAFADEIARLAPSVGMEIGKSELPAMETALSAPDCYDQLPADLVHELGTASLGMLLTDRPYDNNFFWMMNGDYGYFSFYGWSYLTDAPIENGVGLFVASKIIDMVGPGVDHADNTGCINDFMWDKTFVDVLLRSAYLCGDCREVTHFDRGGVKHRLFEDAVRILDAVGEASRKGMSVIAYLQASRPEGREFDAFLCHNSADKPAVRKLRGSLSSMGITAWLDEEQLRPGRPWQVQLEEQIGAIGSALVMVGESGLGPWQDIELRAFLSEFVNRGCPVIPVILPGTVDVPPLPIFLRQFMWVDLRQTTPDPYQQLKWGITGVR